MRISALVRTAIAGAAALWLAAVAAPAQETKPAPMPLSPQPTATALKPGIAVSYYYNFIRTIEELQRWMGYKEGIPGDPIAMLNYNVGEGPMLTSSRSKGLGAHMTGAIKFGEPGTYTFKALTNDGFELNIGGAFILADPDVHYDRWSAAVDVEITEPGWYALDMYYFQRKGTATLELYWRPPWDTGDGDMTLVPADAFAHVPAAGPS